MTWQYSNYSKINLGVSKYFPFTEARQHQLESISEIKHAIDKCYKYIVLEAGTGTWKSAIAATLAWMFDSSYILTITKQLQDQYLHDYSDFSFKLVKGRSNFQCKKYLEDGIRNTCDLGRCVVEGHAWNYSLKNHMEGQITEENTCEYFYQKFLGLISPVTIANYPYMFLELNYVDDFSNRTLMICDEAHNIENMIMNQLTLEFERDDLKEYLKFNLSDECIENLNDSDYNDWINFVENIKEKYVYAIRRKSPFDIKRNPIKTFNEFNMSYNHLKESAPKTIGTIKEILEKHKNEKGIIHTISSQCKNFLIENIQTNRFIFHDTQNRGDVIEEFKNSRKPLVLVSPSVNEGVDLPGDECRFQIIYKIPYPDLGDKQVFHEKRI